MRVLQVENRSFTPFVFSINGRMDREASKCYLRTPEMFCKKRNEPYSVTKFWIQRKLSFSLMKLIIACIRGSRTFKSNKEQQCTSEVASYSKIKCVIQE